MNVDYELMKQICLAPIESFKTLGIVTNTPDGIYIYKDNPKAKVLGVAHLDSVLDLNHFYKLNVGVDSIVMNAQLDDRLGVYILLDILPKLGIEFDLLLTEGEERGRSTAAYFESAKDYNWMFSFDRHGDDVVMYQYDCKELRDDLKLVNFKPGNGSFSDIDFMDHLGIRGINVGTGYEGEHSNTCYASMMTMQAQIKRFQAFYATFKDKKYPYVRATKDSNHYPLQWDYGRGWSKFTDDLCYICDRPSPKMEYYNDVELCPECLGHAAECVECNDVVLDTQLIGGLCAYCRGEE